VICISISSRVDFLLSCGPGVRVCGVWMPSVGSLWMSPGHHSLLSADLFVHILDGNWGLPAASLYL